jgi:hypothetical protein
LLNKASKYFQTQSQINTSSKEQIKKKKLKDQMKKAKETKNKKLSRWWPSGKSLGSRGVLPLWSQVRALWLLI